MRSSLFPVPGQPFPWLWHKWVSVALHLCPSFFFFFSFQHYFCPMESVQWLIQKTSCLIELASEWRELASLFSGLKYHILSGVAWGKLLLLENTCENHEDGHWGIDLEPVASGMVTTHTEAQEDGTCQYQEDIQDFSPNGEPQNAYKQKGQKHWTFRIHNWKVWSFAFITNTLSVLIMKDCRLGIL